MKAQYTNINEAKEMTCMQIRNKYALASFTDIIISLLQNPKKLHQKQNLSTNSAILV